MQSCIKSVKHGKIHEEGSILMGLLGIKSNDLTHIWKYIYLVFPSSTKQHPQSVPNVIFIFLQSQVCRPSSRCRGATGQTHKHTTKYIFKNLYLRVWAAMCPQSINPWTKLFNRTRKYSETTAFTMTGARLTSVFLEQSFFRLLDEKYSLLCSIQNKLAAAVHKLTLKFPFSRFLWFIQHRGWTPCSETSSPFSLRWL